MKPFYVTYFFIMFSVFGYCQKINLNDTIIKNGSVAGIQIGDDIDQIIKLNSNFIFKKEPVYNYGIDGEQMGWLVFYQKEPIFFIWTKGETNILRGFCVLSSKFVLPNNLRVGSTISDFITKYEDFYLTYCDLNGISEFYALPEYLLKKDVYISTLFEFEQPENEYVGIYQNNDFGESTQKFQDTFFKMKRIHIYKWN